MTLIDGETFGVQAFLVCAFAIYTTGISKGGFGGIAIFAVPIMSLIMHPYIAAGIVLPILIIMDAISVHAFRGNWRLHHLKALLPGAMAGLIVGLFTINYSSREFAQFLVGLIAVFSLYGNLLRNGI